MRYDNCEYCGGQVKEKKTTVDVRRGDQLCVFEHVPVGVCVRCGERYYPGPILERLNEMALHGDIATSVVKVPCVDYAEICK